MSWKVVGGWGWGGLGECLGREVVVGLGVNVRDGISENKQQNERLGECPGRWWVVWTGVAG